MKNHFKKNWIKQALPMLERRYPNLSKDELKSKLSKIFDKRCMDREVVIDNNYIKKSQKTSLLAVYDFIEDIKPIVGGHGVLYKNQYQAENPAADMLQNFLSTRKGLKHDMFKLEKGTYEYSTFDRMQLNEKTNSNAYYGCNGNKYSFFYNEYTAPSITSTGQSLISTTKTSFEFILTNSVKLLDLSDFSWYINHILEEKYEIDVDFLPHVSRERLRKRIMGMFLDYKDMYSRVFNAVIDSLTESEIKKIYFKNNIYDFSRIPYVKNLWYNVHDKSDNFIDPYKIPSDIKDELEELWILFKEFVSFPYSPVERIDRLKKHPRKAVVVVDTDSNMITLDPFVTFIRTEIYPSDIDDNRVRFTSINSLSYIMSMYIADVLWKYTKRINIPKEFRKNINMKNEFLFSRIVLAPAKKRYITSVRLREGREIFPEEVDIKGHDFGKSTTRQATRDYFENIIHDELLNKRDINVNKIISLLEEFEDVVRQSLGGGNKDFLIPISPKELEAYKEPFSEQSIRAVIAWNAAEPDMAVSLPTKLDMVKVKLDTPDVLEYFEEHFNKQYKGINKDIFHSQNEYIRNKGVSVIAIPRNIDYIPDWIRPFIDYDTVINDNVSRFYSVLRALGISLVKTKGNVEHFSNILDI